MNNDLINIMYAFRIPFVIVILTAFVLPVSGMVQTETVIPDGFEEKFTNGYPILERLEDIGTKFELTNGSYLNITLVSSESIKLIIDSPPKMVTMRLESASNATSTEIMMNGFAPGTSYNKYEDDYHNLVTFTADDSGNYSYIQDISKPHYIFIQPEFVESTIATIEVANVLPDVIFINDNKTGGHCTLIGKWDSSTKTCTMTGDIDRTIQIDSDGITLNGNEHSDTGIGTGSGLYISKKKYVTIKNLRITNFTDGIYLQNIPPEGAYGNISNDNISSNYRHGIYLLFGRGYNLANNNVSLNNGKGIFLERTSYNNLLYNNVSYNNGTGIDLYQSSNTMLIGNNASNNLAGITSYQTGLNIFENNIINSNHCNGIRSRSCTRCTFFNNTANSNLCDGIFIYYYTSYNNVSYNTANMNFYSGIVLGYVDRNNTLMGNNASNNNKNGIHIAYSDSNNTLHGNSVSNNNNSGIYLMHGKDTNISGNIAIDNFYGIHLESSNNNTIHNNYFRNNINALDNNRNKWNLSKTSGVNILGGQWLGGNYWSDYEGIDTNGDTLGDTMIPHDSSGNITLGGDNLPLISIFEDGPPFLKSKYNNKTNDNSSNIILNISETVLFNATPNQTIIEWNWFVNGEKQNINSDIFSRLFITPGDYSIEVNAANDNGTSNNMTWYVNVLASETRSISGFKINDSNGNGKWDEDEKGLPNWNIWLISVVDKGKNSRIIWEFTTTDTEGFYKFENLTEDRYFVIETLKKGYVHTSSLIHIIEFDQIMSATNCNFTNRPVYGLQ